MTWWRDGRYRLTTTTGATLKAGRAPLARLGTPELAYRVPGWALLEEGLPHHTPEMRGATVQLAAEDVAREPDVLELQLLLIPRGHVPEHRESMGDRVIEEGDPSIWVRLAPLGDAGAPVVATHV